MYFYCAQGKAGGEEEEKPAWSVLRDDFMMGASMKDWDKESDGEDGDEPETRQAAEDSDSDWDRPPVDDKLMACMWFVNQPTLEEHVQNLCDLSGSGAQLFFIPERRGLKGGG